MALLVKSNGTAEATTDENKQQTQAQGQTNTQAAGTVEKKAAEATTAGSTATSVPEAAAAGTTTNKGTDFSKVSLTYDGKYDEQLADLYNQITNRKPFEYSTEDDQLYQQYVDKYVKGGKLAMEDTMGQAAALTGGYGNSYAQRVGQQTYDEYMTGLNDKAIELEERAYQRYQDQGDALQQQYAMLGQLADDDYQKWGDAYERAMSEAALRANSGDFDPYKQLYGDEAGQKMLDTYAAQVLMPLYTNGQIDAEKYKELTGVYPVGYVEPGAGGGGGNMDNYNAAMTAAGYNPFGKGSDDDDSSQKKSRGQVAREAATARASDSITSQQYANIIKSLK